MVIPRGNLYDAAQRLEAKSKENMVCRLKNPLWSETRFLSMVIKFDEVVTKFGFNEKNADQCIDLKVPESKSYFCPISGWYSLASNDIWLLRNTEQIFFKNSLMSDLGEAFLGIEKDLMVCEVFHNNHILIKL